MSDTETHTPEPISPIRHVLPSCAGPEVLGRIIAHRNARHWEQWINTYTLWGHSEESRICEWAHEFVQHLEAALHQRGFVFEYNTHTMTRRMLYWCWGMKNAMASPNWTSLDIPMCEPCKENSNDPYEYELYVREFSYRYWMDLQPFWIPDFMNDEFATQFIALLELFCWRHVSTERSPTIQKERDKLDAEQEDGSGDEGRISYGRGITVPWNGTGADNGSYFKGNKEYY